MKKKIILITGAAGFIGFSFCEKLLEKKNVQIKNNLATFHFMDLV